MCIHVFKNAFVQIEIFQIKAIHARFLFEVLKNQIITALETEQTFLWNINIHCCILTNQTKKEEAVRGICFF